MAHIPNILYIFYIHLAAVNIIFASAQSNSFLTVQYGSQTGSYYQTLNQGRITTISNWGIDIHGIHIRDWYSDQQTNFENYGRDSSSDTSCDPFILSSDDYIIGYKIYIDTITAYDDENDQTDINIQGSYDVINGLEFYTRNKQTFSCLSDTSMHSTTYTNLYDKQLQQNDFYYLTGWNIYADDVVNGIQFQFSKLFISDPPTIDITNAPTKSPTTKPTRTPTIRPTDTSIETTTDDEPQNTENTESTQSLVSTEDVIVVSDKGTTTKPVEFNDDVETVLVAKPTKVIHHVHGSSAKNGLGLVLWSVLVIILLSMIFLTLLICCGLSLFVMYIKRRNRTLENHANLENHQDINHEMEMIETKPTNHAENNNTTPIITIAAPQTSQIPTYDEVEIGVDGLDGGTNCSSELNLDVLPLPLPHTGEHDEDRETEQDDDAFESMYGSHDNMVDMISVVNQGEDEEENRMRETGHFGANVSRVLRLLSIESNATDFRDTYN